MKAIVQLDKNNHVFTTTLIIAEGVNLEHRAVRQLIKNHIIDFKELGERTFEMSFLKTKNKPISYYKLSELQASFLITLMKNSRVVISFKKTLVKEFFRMQKELARISINQANQQWLEQRSSGKLERRAETDVIKNFVDYATKQGSQSANMYYMNISKMENKALFIVEQKYRNLRDVLGITDLSTLQNADHIVAKALKDGMNDNLNYKDIYKLAKERVELFASLRGKEKLSAPNRKELSIEKAA